MELSWMRVGVVYKESIALYTEGNFRHRHVSYDLLFTRCFSRIQNWFFFVFATLISIRVSATQCAELAVNDDGR